MRAVGVRREPGELVGRYYRELAMPHVLPFPAQRLARVGDPLPEGLDPWEAGSGLEAIDWFESLARSPVVIPGVTTVQRAFGVTEGGEPETRPPDLYVGIDCSGSMGNPSKTLAYPVVAGVVLTLSALRAGARVMACLSGEWHGQGQFTETAGFLRDERALLGVLTDYLGTGCSFGLPRLVKTFVEAPPPARSTARAARAQPSTVPSISPNRSESLTISTCTGRAGAGASTKVLTSRGSPNEQPVPR